MSKNSRLDNLEEKFKDPEIELYESKFEEYIEHHGAIGASRSVRSFEKDFYALLDYLNLDIVTYPERKVVRKRLTKKAK